jgi:tRNA A-37 threonylcarbamoyl transferase component Bud32
MLVPWSNSKKEAKVHRLFRLGTIYKALRYLRSIGLRTPLIESVVIDKALLITEYINGTNLKILADGLLAGKNEDSYCWLEVAGEEIAKIHTNHSILRGLRPANLIISDHGIFFTGLDGFNFVSDNPICDIVHLMTHILGRTSNVYTAKKIVDAFFLGYRRNIHDIDLNSLTIAEKYLGSLYPIISSPNRNIILDELRK